MCFNLILKKIKEKRYNNKEEAIYDIKLFCKKAIKEEPYNIRRFSAMAIMNILPDYINKFFNAVKSNKGRKKKNSDLPPTNENTEMESPTEVIEE
jgi:hypothetical protein